MHLLAFRSGSEGAAEAALRSATVLGAGLASYRLVAKSVWALGMTEEHVGRGEAVDACVFPWQEVSTQVLRNNYIIFYS